MLDIQMKNQVTELFKNLESSYLIKINVNPNHEYKAELVELINEVAMCSEKISVEILEGESLLVSILKNNKETGISFRAVPGGHEFTSLLLAILNADNKGKNLPDEFIVKRIKALKGDIKLSSYISLSCTNCPEVVQTLNICSLINPNITHEAIDGSIFQEEADKMQVKAVPTVFANGELLYIGKGGMVDLLEKLELMFGSESIESSETKEYDVVIAGGGVAGATAAIYSARKGLKVAVVAEKIGGQVNETVGIENITSIVSTTGKELAYNVKQHLQAYKIDILENRRIERAIVENGIKKLEIKGGESVSAPALIIATGASWRRLNVPGEQDYIGRGVAFCPHCDGPFYKGKDVVVVGGGNSGIEAAIDLSGICKSVTVLEFMENLKADTVLQDKANSIGNIKIMTNVQTLEIVGDGEKVVGIKIKDRGNGNEEIIKIDGVFVQIGLKANSDIFKDIVETNRIGEIHTDNGCRTAVSGVYAAGDVSDVAYKQIIIAMGEGAKSALSAFDDRVRGVLI